MKTKIKILKPGKQSGYFPGDIVVTDNVDIIKQYNTIEIIEEDIIEVKKPSKKIVKK